MALSLAGFLLRHYLVVMGTGLKWIEPVEWFAEAIVMVWLFGILFKPSSRPSGQGNEASC